MLNSLEDKPDRVQEACAFLKQQDEKFLKVLKEELEKAFLSN